MSERKTRAGAENASARGHESRPPGRECGGHGGGGGLDRAHGSGRGRRTAASPPASLVRSGVLHVVHHLVARPSAGVLYLPDAVAASRTGDIAEGA